MLVTLHTPTHLKIRDSGIWGRLLGVILLLSGGGMSYLGWQNWLAGGALGRGPEWVPFFVGALFLAAGFAILFVARTTTHYFDRQRGKVTVEARSLRGALRREYNLADVADVVLEEHTSRSSEEDAQTVTYRVVYVLRTGERVPWTPYFTGTRKDKEACVEAVRDFLGAES